MTLDDLMKQSFAFLEQAQRTSVFDKADPKLVTFPEQQRQARMAELKAQIADLARRKAEAAAAYEAAIAAEQQELDALNGQQPAPAPPAAAMPATAKSARGKKA